MCIGLEWVVNRSCTGVYGCMYAESGYISPCIKQKKKREFGPCIDALLTCYDTLRMRVFAVGCAYLPC